MTSQAARAGCREVRPLMSIDRDEARKRVLNLYKAWCREIPFIHRRFDINKSIRQCKKRLREEFLRYEDITDIRVIDMLVIKGHMELKEAVNVWKQKSHIMFYFKDTWTPRPKDFLTRFYEGHDHL